MNQIMMILILINNLIFNMMKNPLILSISLFFQILLICIFMGFVSQTFWFSYILFLIFIGGMLILFMYLISLISNEKFNIKNIKPLSLIYFFIIILLMFFFKSSTNLNNLEIYEFSLMKSIFQENSLNLNKLYNFPTNIINILLIKFLFLMLMITLKITNFFSGPFRNTL